MLLNSASGTTITGTTNITGFYVLFFFQPKLCSLHHRVRAAGPLILRDHRLPTCILHLMAQITMILS